MAMVKAGSLSTSAVTMGTENEAKAKKKTLACPICYDKLIWNGDPVFTVDSTPLCILKCGICKKSLQWLPLVSFLYERGWRQAFTILGGFPGPEREFELMRDYLKPVIGGTIIDASCGSGMFTRLFAKSGLFSLVVALDFSESTLKQSYDYIKQEESISKQNLILVRADIARLPFASSSIDVVHAGAALHCWPSPSAGEPGFNENEAKKKILACPICYDPLMWNADPVFSVDSTPRSILKCGICEKVYSGNENHLDLTVTSGGEYRPASSEIFRLPLVSYLYGRGWRQAFTVCGFPGPEREFELMRDYLKPVIGGTIIDASCGSGMFTRLFAKSGQFSLVVALDFSESVLKQSYDYIKQEERVSKENLILVRADIARLPFASSFIDAVHAGAAIHCWPSPSAGVAEISRILRPGGVFVATTFTVDGLYSFIPFLSSVRQNIRQFSGSRIYLSERELRELLTNCGLVNYTCIRNRGFVMISARKPE